MSSLADALDFKPAVSYTWRHRLPLPKPPKDADARTPPLPLRASPNSGPILAHYVRRESWPNYAREELDRRPLEAYKHAWRKHVEPYLGDLPLSAIGPKVVRTWLNELRDVHAASNRRCYRTPRDAICNPSVAART